jgi:hypothetical protein
MKYKVGLYFFLVLLLLPGLVNVTPVQAGDPDGTIGPPNTNLLVCANLADHAVVPLDSDAFDGFSEDTLTFNPDIEVNVEQLKGDCKDAEELFKEAGVDIDFEVEFLQQTRIQGYVFEFHPDPNGPGGWTAVRSRDVPVVASGPGFEIVWGSEHDGFYYFDNLGAGPITLNLRLPPDGHPINPNIVVMSRSFKEVWTVELGFYRGPIAPGDPDTLRLPDDYPIGTLIPADTILELDEETGLISEMPNVGGVLPQDQPISVLALAAVVLVMLPAVGIYKLRRKKRVED